MSATAEPAMHGNNSSSSSVSGKPPSSPPDDRMQWTSQHKQVGRHHGGARKVEEEEEEDEDEGENENKDNRRGAESVVGDLPTLQRASALFDTAVATEALFARLRQRQLEQESRERAQPPPTQPMEGAEPSARRPASIPIASVLGRPPTAPPVSSSTAAAATGPSTEAFPFSSTFIKNNEASHDGAQRELSASSSPRRASSSFRAYQRSASPTSTADYVDIEHKQNELRYAVEHHIQSLERALSMRDEEVATLTSRLRKLEEDYQFNYNLIAERDAALEEAAAQLQRLYRELKRLTDEAARTGKKVEGAEADLRAARQRVREVEEERDAAVRQVQKDYAIKERHLFDTVRAKEAALQQEQQEQHEWYKSQVKLLEEERAGFADRSASLSLEAEERTRQQVGRLQTELTALQRELKAARQAKVEDDRRLTLLQEAKEGLLHEIQLAQERHDAFVQEATQAKKEVEERLARVVTESEKRTTAAEAAVREESARASRLELERTRLQATLAEVQERLQHLTAQYDDDVARYTKERQALLRRSDDAVAATAAVEQRLQDTQREAEKQGRLAAEEAERLRAELERSRGACEATKQELTLAQEKCAKWEAAATHLEAEVRRWKSEEDKTATSGRQERSAWEERCRVAERQLQLLQEDAQQATKLQQTAVEKAQAEAMRLTRELHASEAARRTLEDQFHLLEDYKEERNALQTLRMEKEQLQRRVTELEHTNEEVRQQVAAFTAELQNDPVLKAAKETQQRVVELQQELAEAKSEQQLLRDNVKEKEDELARYQTEMLRVQVLMGDATSTATLDALAGNGRVHHASYSTHAGAAPATATTAMSSVGLSDQVSRALQRQQQEMRAEYSKMRQSYEEMVRELDRQRRRRRYKAAQVTRSSSSSSSVESSAPHSRFSSPSSSPSTLHTSRSAKSAHRERRVRRHGSRAAEEKASAALPPVLPDSKAAFLLQETEVWRQRCTQLEQQLQAVLRERDRLQKELQLAKQDATALGAEKQSLIDLNALLKAQLREAYRMRTGDGGARGTAGTTTAATTAAAAADASPPATVKVSPELLAAALQALEEQSSESGVRGGLTRAAHLAPTSHATPSFPRSEAAAGRLEEGGARANAAPAAATPIRGNSASSMNLTRKFGGAGAVNLNNGGGDAGFSAQAAQERLAALEREIDDVRGQLSSTMSGGASQSSRQPIVRRGNAAVRHYGYGA